MSGFADVLRDKLDEMDVPTEEVTESILGDVIVKAEKKVTQKCAIGSIKRGIVNYAVAMKAFQADDVPAHARNASMEMKDLKDPDKLGRKNPRWNSSISVPLGPYKRHVDNETFRFEVRNKLLDVALPKYRPPKIYTGTETRDRLLTWNQSNIVQTPDYKGQAEKASANTKSKRIHKMYLSGKYVRTPKQQISDLNASFRQEKVDTNEQRQKIREQYEYDNPGTSEAKMQAYVLRILNEQKIRQHDIPDPEATFKPNIKKTLPVDKVKTYYHSGVYETITIGEGEQIQAWSCCMCEDPNDAGCNVRLNDRKKWQVNLL